ncbi:hypothetical protein [Chryseobacterium mucoviscidosis]|uniref:hypothetical protein n=1 Tax=Chryseobacterium mucoviscidosis TaxID=1945581 RepID=UPI000F4E879F|nr:hypothetical protein [Chryseobacterium mucoviscidosis]
MIIFIYSDVVYILFGAYSRYPLYLLGYGLRLAPSATQKDAVSIGAKIFLHISIVHCAFHWSRISFILQS